MNRNKIQLVVAPLPESVFGVGNGGVFPAAGVQSLATYVSLNRPEKEIEILDGTILSLEQILNRLDAPVVGVSALGPTYETALPILKLAKRNGSTTLLGGHHTYFLANEIMKNRSFIDYLIRGDNAELAFLEFIDYLDGNIYSPYLVSSLVFRDGDKIIKNKIEQLNLSDIPFIDRSFTSSPEIFTDNYNEQFEKWHDSPITGTAVTKNAQGCGQGSSKRCIYCTIPDMRFRKKTPEQFWAELRYMQKEYDINFVFETADSFSSFFKVPYRHSNYLDMLAKSKPIEVETQLLVFARADEISSEVISYFKDIGVKRVNMGLDAGDDTMLSSGIGKGNTGVATNWRAVELLHDAGIQMYVSFVLGGIGETENSLKNTYNFAHALFDYDHVVVVDSSPLLPLKGAPSWKYVQDAFVGQDLIDTEYSARLWAERMCEVDYETISSYNEAILNLAKCKGQVPGGFGIKNV